jgi:DNA mismatch repair protein MutL
MAQIHILPDLLISQIAAGEVVERPASALKELLENSLDAGARDIAVQLVEGGIRRIRVADDGKGIAREELALALSRHATSKIGSLEDLEAVATLGFRGEALASIASVAHLSLTSKAADSPHAWKIEASGGPVGNAEPAALPAGTTIDVRDLYFNTPARRKFLRKPATEFAHAEETFKRVALSAPSVRFSLSHNERAIWRLNPGTFEQRIHAVLGEAFREAALTVDAGSDAFRLKGLVAQPAYSRAGRDAQYFFVNGRYVRDKVLAHAVREAYHDVLHHDRHAAYVLFLELDPRLVDVNVHPTKTEVRFRESQAVHQFVFHALNRALAGTTAGANVSASPGIDAAMPPRPFSPAYPRAQAAMDLRASEGAGFYSTLFGAHCGGRARS